MKEAEEFGPFRQISLDMMNKLKKDGFKNIRFTDILAKEDVSYVRFRYESDEKTQGVNRIAQFT